MGIAAAMKAANLKLAADQKKLNDDYKATMAKLSATNKANQKKFDAAQKEAQKKFAAKFAGNKAAAAAAQAAIAASVKAANKEAAAKADRAYQRDMQEAGQKKAKADRAAGAEKAAKKAAEKKGKADEKETKASTASDMAIKECAIDGSECQTPDGKCKKVTPKGPFMGDDLVSCADKKPTEEADAGLSWAGIEPPLPPQKCPPVTAACKAAKKKCGGLKTCKAGMAKGAVKGLIHVGCKGTKASLMAFFAFGAHCCDPKNIGFSHNIDMFKMQITSMPVYHNMGTTGRFKAYHGAGSVCGVVKSLAAGVAAGDDGGVFLQKGFKEVAAKHKAANGATDKAHAAT